MIEGHLHIPTKWSKKNTGKTVFFWKYIYCAQCDCSCREELYLLSPRVRRDPIAFHMKQSSFKAEQLAEGRKNSAQRPGPTAHARIPGARPLDVSGCDCRCLTAPGRSERCRSAAPSLPLSPRRCRHRKHVPQPVR